MKIKNKEIVLEKDNNLTSKVLFIIFVFTLLLYGNSIKNNYALDDNYVTIPKGEVGNLRVEKGIKGIPEIFRSHYVESAEQSFEYRPLVLTTFAIEYQFFGSNPHISHFISILLYAITCMLLFTILAKLLKNYNIIFPLLVIFLFIIHPIHTEVVDNIKCRDELLSFLFGLCALHFFIKSIEVDSRKWQFIALAILFLWLGLLCKRTAALFIIFIPLTGYFFYDFKIKKLLVFMAAFFIAFMAYSLFRRSMIHDIVQVRSFVFFENPIYYDHSILTRLSLVLHTLEYYLKLLVFPYPLCCYYGYNTIAVNWSSPLIYVSLLFYLAITIYAFIKLPQKSIFTFAAIIFLSGALPFANILTPVVGIIGERFIYFASFGYCIMAAYALLKFFKIDITNRTLKIQNTVLSFKVIAMGVLLIYSGMVISRNTKWKDKLTLYRHDVSHHENSYILQKFTASTLYEKSLNAPSEYEKHAMQQEALIHIKNAAELLREGLRTYKTDYFTLTTLGTIYNNYLNDVNTALLYFKQSLLINPNYDVTKFNIGFCYEKKNLPDSAILVYEKMITANTTYPPVYLNLHELYINKKEYRKAVVSDEKAIQQCPLDFRVKAYVNLGNTFMLVEDTLNAIKSFQKAVELEPGFTDLRKQVAAFIKSTGHDKAMNNHPVLK